MKHRERAACCPHKRPKSSEALHTIKKGLIEDLPWNPLFSSSRLLDSNQLHRVIVRIARIQSYATWAQGESSRHCLYKVKRATKIAAAPHRYDISSVVLGPSTIHDMFSISSPFLPAGSAKSSLEASHRCRRASAPTMATRPVKSGLETAAVEFSQLFAGSFPSHPPKQHPFTLARSFVRSAMRVRHRHPTLQQSFQV